MAKVLLVDDELTMVQMVTEMLRHEGHEVFPYTNSKDAFAGLEAHTPEVVVTDLYLDKTRAHGLDILQKARSMTPPASVIVITAFGSIETAVEAMKSGAYDYLEKPFQLDELNLCIQRALNYNEAISENLYLRKQLKKKYQFSQIIGTAPKMQAVFKMIERVADTDSTILIRGESGTGKELVARALHFNSRRQFAPFIPVNCSALPENLLESELFGHRKGSFTGAVNDKKGLFHEADGGTIFLDEIGSMSAMLQSRLLRVLQEREVRRVGENTPTYINVRVLAATNEALEKKIKDGSFREDLYYRLNVIPINMPSLRERREDIPLLVAHFLRDKINPAHRPAHPDHPPGHGNPQRARLAGQCPRTGKRHRTRRHALRRQHHPGTRSARRRSPARRPTAAAGEIAQLPAAPPPNFFRCTIPPRQPAPTQPALTPAPRNPISR